MSLIIISKHSHRLNSVLFVESVSRSRHRLGSRELPSYSHRVTEVMIVPAMRDVFLTYRFPLDAPANLPVSLPRLLFLCHRLSSSSSVFIFVFIIIVDYFVYLPHETSRCLLPLSVLVIFIVPNYPSVPMQLSFTRLELSIRADSKMQKCFY